MINKHAADYLLEFHRELRAASRVWEKSAKFDFDDRHRCRVELIKQFAKTAGISWTLAEEAIVAHGNAVKRHPKPERPISGLHL